MEIVIKRNIQMILIKDFLLKTKEKMGKYDLLDIPPLEGGTADEWM